MCRQSFSQYQEIKKTLKQGCGMWLPALDLTRPGGTVAAAVPGSRMLYFFINC